jgi:hypothetical protein
MRSISAAKASKAVRECGSRSLPPLKLGITETPNGENLRRFQKLMPALAFHRADDGAWQRALRHVREV